MNKIPSENCSDIEKVFSESNSRFIATVAPEKAAEFEKVLAGVPLAKVGTVISEPVLKMTGKEEYKLAVGELLEEYKSTLDQI